MSAVPLQQAKHYPNVAVSKIFDAYPVSDPTLHERMEITVRIPCDFTDGQNSVVLTSTDLEDLFREKWRLSDHWTPETPSLPGKINFKKAKVRKIIKQGRIVDRTPEKSHTRMNLYNLRIVDNERRKLINTTRVFRAGQKTHTFEDYDYPLMHIADTQDDIVIFESRDNEEDEEEYHFDLSSLKFYDENTRSGYIYKTPVPGYKPQAVIAMTSEDTLHTLQTLLRCTDIVDFGTYDPLQYREWLNDVNNQDRALGTIRLPLDLCKNCINAASRYVQRADDGKHDLTTLTIKLVPSSKKQESEPEGSMALVLTADVTFSEVY
ncbi:hypothetical protein CYMTET_48675 [Cymbomonas tetramitiformis]|uniref:Uncharacterized protein n=1 Tax=Cymbomonas tetramitiformis TaxID=36881 RepID=A0AAE0BRR0_9CHLO|nr:hypothetical protein CYMTET_48675 [Cymbomonas tetramitiformis]|eukprot:gene5515-6684_t